MNYEYSIFLKDHYFHVESGAGLVLSPHTLPGYDLITVLEGELQIRVDEQFQRLQSGQSALIFPHQIRSTESTDCQFHRYIFSDRIPISFTAKKNMMIPTDFRFTLSSPILELLLTTAPNDSYYGQKGLIYLICNAFDQNRTYVSRKNTGDLTTKMMLYVDQNFKNPLLEQELSKNFAYDHGYLLRVFDHTTGMPFKKYVHLRRLGHARYLLECSQFSILQCAEEAGFSCIRSFNRIFKEHFGRTPKEHRKQYQR